MQFKPIRTLPAQCFFSAPGYIFITKSDILFTFEKRADIIQKIKYYIGNNYLYGYYISSSKLSAITSIPRITPTMVILLFSYS